VDRAGAVLDRVPALRMKIWFPWTHLVHLVETVQGRLLFSFDAVVYVYVIWDTRAVEDEAVVEKGVVLL